MSFLRTVIEKVKHIFPQKTSAAVLAFLLAMLYLKKISTKEIPSLKLSRFLKLVSENSIKEVCVSGHKIFFKVPQTKGWLQTNAEILTKDRIYELLREKNNIEFSSRDLTQGSFLLNVAIYAAFYYLGYKLFDYYLNKKKGGRSLDPSYSSNTKFIDIYGVEQAKKELQEIINYLKAPSKYKDVGARLRRGVLLYGPSGVGKTMLARAVAGEAKVAFLSCAASEFIELYVGVGPKRVRELFEKARKLAPCIIFIDEIDGIGLKRKSQFSSLESGSDNERTSTLNQLLTEMDGFRGNEDIVIIAATNRANLLDEALLRSGRFDTKIKLELPNIDEREGIMRVHLRNKKQQVSSQILKKIALDSDNYSGADLENLVNESAYICIQKGRDIIMDDDIKDAFSKIKKQTNISYI